MILIMAPLFFGCGGRVTGENKNSASASSISLHPGNEKYFILNTKESFVAWTGSSVEGKHQGYASMSKGELMIENGQLMGGAIEINMNKIEDNNHERDNNLINHLKGPDFFDVKNFPVSTIVITKVDSINGENMKVTGNLTIKGITHPVTFPAKVNVEKGGIVKANGKLVIDRTLWGVRNNSGKFYNNLADKTISDSIEFQMTIVALSSLYYTSPVPGGHGIYSKYEYTDSDGKNIIIQNSFPKGGAYTHPTGKEIGYRIFWTRVINETASPLELTINFPADSLAISSQPDSYFKLFVLPNAMTPGKESLDNYGSGLESFLDTAFYKPTRLHRTIHPKEECLFNIGLVTLVNGVARTGLVLKGQDLFYRISISGQVDSALIPCGQIVLKR
jgi:polyisoprenoid-binding protein YceI